EPRRAAAALEAPVGDVRRVRRLRRALRRDRARRGRLPALALGRGRVPAPHRLAGPDGPAAAAVSWAAHDLEPYAFQRHFRLKVAFIPLLIGSYAPDMMSKWFVYGIHLGPWDLK